MSAEPLPSSAWDRIPGESARAYATALAYFEMGAGRSLRAVHEAVSGGDPTATPTFDTVTTWSRKNHWVNRAAAYDDYMVRARQLRAIDETPRMAERQAGMGLRLQRLGLAKLRTYVPRYDDQGRQVALRPGQRYADEMPVDVALRMIELGIRVERVARGEPDPSAPTITGPVLVNPVLAAVRSDPSRLAEVAEELGGFLDRLSNVVDGTAVRIDDDVPG